MKFEQIKGKLGFGCMRLPMNGTEVDLVEFEKMVDEFINAGFNYFDTAHVYIDGKSELAMKEALVKRYPREAYLIIVEIIFNISKYHIHINLIIFKIFLCLTIFENSNIETISTYTSTFMNIPTHYLFLFWSHWLC